MPNIINIKIYWDDEKFSFATLSPNDIDDMMMGYGRGQQFVLFSFVELETIRQWAWDIYCREPEKIEIDSIIF